MSKFQEEIKPAFPETVLTLLPDVGRGIPESLDCVHFSPSLAQELEKENTYYAKQCSFAH